MLKKDIETLEKIQRRFTKRIPGLKDLTYCQRLPRSKLDSLELLDLLFTYKLVFGLTDLKLSDFFLLRSDARSQGHPYKLFLPCCSSTTRHNYFTHRVARAWNNLPENSTNFSSLALLKRSLSSNILARYCKIYYFWTISRLGYINIRLCYVVAPVSNRAYCLFVLCNCTAM